MARLYGDLTDYYHKLERLEAKCKIWGIDFEDMRRRSEGSSWTLEDIIDLEIERVKMRTAAASQNSIRDLLDDQDLELERERIKMTRYDIQRQKSRTFYGAVNDLGEAWRRFVNEVAKALRIPQLLDFMTGRRKR